MDGHFHCRKSKQTVFIWEIRYLLSSRTYCSPFQPSSRLCHGLLIYLSRRYAAVKAAASNTVLRVDKSRSISTTLVNVFLIVPVIMMHAALCVRCSSVSIGATSIPVHHTTAACVTYGITAYLQSHSVILGVKPQGLHLFLHQILRICFPHQFFIKGDTKAFNFLCRSQLPVSFLRNTTIF